MYKYIIKDFTRVAQLCPEQRLSVVRNGITADKVKQIKWWLSHARTGGSISPVILTKFYSSKNGYLWPFQRLEPEMSKVALVSFSCFGYRGLTNGEKINATLVSLDRSFGSGLPCFFRLGS